MEDWEGRTIYIIKRGRHPDQWTRKHALDEMPRLSSGLRGFIVCRADQPKRVQAFYRTLFKNFAQTRGMLILTDDDLRRMVAMANRGQQASAYLRDGLSEFATSV